MKPFKAMQIKIEDELPVDRGHLMLDFDSIRKVAKVKDPAGKYCARISFKGLGSEEDIYIRETPEVLARFYFTQQSDIRVLQAEYTPIKISLAKPSNKEKLREVVETEFAEQELTYQNGHI